MKTISNNPKTVEQVRHLFFLFNKLNITNENRADLVYSYTNGRKESVKDLDFIEAQTMIRRLTDLTRKGTHYREDKPDMDKKRKGVIKAIFRYLELKQHPANMDYVKAIACRAAGCDYFNEISEDALTRIYNEFCRKQHTVTERNSIIDELIKMN